MINILFFLLGIIAAFTYFLLCKDPKEKESNLQFKQTLAKAGLPIVEILLEGKALNMIVDSGSTTSYLDQSVFNTLKDYQNKGTVNIFGINGSAGTAPKISTTIDLEKKSIKTGFLVKDLKETFSPLKKNTSIPVDGLLGSDFLKQNNCVVDYGTNRLYINAA